MPASGFFANRRRRYGLLAALSAGLLVAGLLPLPGIDRPAALAALLTGIGAGGLIASLMLCWSPGLLDTYPRNKTWRILLEAAPPLLLYMLAVGRWPDPRCWCCGRAGPSRATCACWTNCSSVSNWLRSRSRPG